MSPDSVLRSLHHKIAACELQLQQLRQQLAEAEFQNQQQQQNSQIQQRASSSSDPLAHDFSYGLHDDFRSEVFAALSQTEPEPIPPRRWPLENNEYTRYGRQLIMPEIGLQGTRHAVP